MAMTIGDVIAVLATAKPDVRVYFSFCGCVPTRVGSWRGIYAEPALGWAAAGYSGSGQYQTVADLLAELARATDGRRYDGWKGGEYAYDRSDTLHVDNPGDYTQTELQRVEVTDYSVTLHTAYEEL